MITCKRKSFFVGSKIILEEPKRLGYFSFMTTAEKASALMVDHVLRDLRSAGETLSQVIDLESLKNPSSESAVKLQAWDLVKTINELIYAARSLREEVLK